MKTVLEREIGFRVRQPWTWGDVRKNRTGIYRFGKTITIEHTPYRVIESEEAPDDEVMEAIFNYMEPLGYLYYINFLYHGFQSLLLGFENEVGLSSDGSIPVVDGDILFAHAKVDAYLSALVSTGDKLVDKMEHYLNKVYCKESVEATLWKRVNSYYYDTLLEYALLAELRNITQHDRFAVNLVGRDLLADRAYVVFNLDHGYDNLSLKPHVRKRIKEYAERKRLEAALPRISVVKSISIYAESIVSFYYVYKVMMIPYILAKSKEIPLELKHGCREFDCITRLIDDNGDFFPNRRDILIVEDPGMLREFQSSISDDRPYLEKYCSDELLQQLGKFEKANNL